MTVKQIFDDSEKRQIARRVLEVLTEWFGISEAGKTILRKARVNYFFAAIDSSSPVGFLYLKELGKDTVELHVMDVLKEYHRRGIGRRLLEVAKSAASACGYSFMQVKTIHRGIYEEYDRTNRFYISIGFKEFEILLTLWDECNPC